MFAGILCWACTSGTSKESGGWRKEQVGPGRVHFNRETVKIRQEVILRGGGRRGGTAAGAALLQAWQFEVWVLEEEAGVSWRGGVGVGISEPGCSKFYLIFV